MTTHVTLGGGGSILDACQVGQFLMRVDSGRGVRIIIEKIRSANAPAHAMVERRVLFIDDVAAAPGHGDHATP